ncbi:MAG TPA: cellulose biosynthesis cyclic di-GMP-binding regulatory protein BcsB [Chloroflexia bacterium]|nr:cellulose biosynthesis cyclic di-GMP-binding regulatory protein BcsB [Chloroflexia bacterium]
MKFKYAILSFLILFACVGWLAIPATPAGAQSTTTATAYSFTLKDRGYDVTTVRGLVASAEFFLPGPGAVQLTADSKIRLHFSYSDLLQGDKSSFTVRLNGHDTTGLSLATGKGAEQWLDVPLSPDLVNPDFNSLQLVFYLRRDTGDQVCSDPNDPLLWATIFPDTSILYSVGAPIQFDTTLNLANYPAPLYRAALGPDPAVDVLLPANPSDTVLTAASSMVAWLGQASSGRALHPVVYSDGTLPAAPSLAIGTGKDFAWLGDQNLPLKYDAAGNQYLDYQGKPIAPDTGVLQIFEWQQNEKDVAPVLLVSGGSEEGVRRAALSLASRSYVKLLHGQYALITEAPDIDSLAKGDITPGQHTFGELTLSTNDPTVKGRGRQSVSVSFFLPQNFKFDVNPEAIIHFSHADGLDDRSLLIVEVNGTAIGSTRLDEKNTTGGSLSLAIPASVLRSGANSLSAIFDMRPQDDNPCDSGFDDVAWGTIHHDSNLDLPFVEATSQADLSVLGAPFIRAGALQDTTVVLPQAPDTEVVSQTLTLAARLGGQTKSDMTYLPVITANDPSTLPSDHLIVVGMPGVEPLIPALQAVLPLQFNSEGTLEWRGKKVSEASDAPVLLSVQNQQPIGILQIVASPWHQERSVLLVSGTSERSIGWAVDAVTKGSLNGNLALITEDGHVSTLSLQESRPLTAVIIQQESPVWVAILAGVVIIVLLVITVLLTAFRMRAGVREAVSE